MYYNDDVIWPGLHSLHTSSYAGKAHFLIAVTTVHVQVNALHCRSAIVSTKLIYVPLRLRDTVARAYAYAFTARLQ